MFQRARLDRRLASLREEFVAHEQVRYTHVWGANEAIDRVVCLETGIHYCEAGNPAPPGKRAYHARCQHQVRGDRRWNYCEACGHIWADAATLTPAGPSPL